MTLMHAEQFRIPIFHSTLGVPLIVCYCFNSLDLFKINGYNSGIDKSLLFL